MKIPHSFVIDRFVKQAEAELEQEMRESSGPVCPACGKKTRLHSEDQFGTIRVECRTHGRFTLQKGLM
jgi:hypothetical protein